MKPTKQQLIAAYSETLAKYEADGDPMAAVQRRLIATLKAAVAKEANA